MYNPVSGADVTVRTCGVAAVIFESNGSNTTFEEEAP